MGVDLTLMPVLLKGSWLCHEMLICPRDNDLFAEIAKIDKTEVEKPVQSFRALDEAGNQTYGALEFNPYGIRLTWLPAGDLYKAFVDCDHRKARAIRAFLLELGRDWPVVLYWH